MNDNKLVELMAQTWVNNGGDTIGMEFCWKKIRDRIQEIIQDKED